MNSTQAKSYRWLWILTIITLAVLLISVYAPSGFNLPAFGDEWPLVAYSDAGIPVITSSPTRSFLLIPIRISYLMSTDNFAGFNVYQAIMIFLHGVLIYVLFRLILPNNRSLALVISALAMFYPGDVAAYILSNVHYVTAIVLYLIALIALVKYWQNQNVIWLVIVGLAQVFCLGMYEGSAPLILLSPLILVYLQRGFTKRVIRVAFYWYVIPILWIVRVILLSSDGHGLEYQSGMISSDNSIPALIGGFIEVVAREFGRIWLWAELTAPQGFSNPLTWLVLGVTFFFGCILWLHRKATQEAFSLRDDLILIVAGIGILIVCYAPFVITEFRFGFFRTMLFGLSGAAIALAVTCWLIVRAPLVFRLLLTCIFVFWAASLLSHTSRLPALLILTIGIGFILPRDLRYVVVGAGFVGYAIAFNIGFRAHQPYSNLLPRQQALMTSIAEQAPAVTSKSLILLTGAPDEQEQYATVRDRFDIFQGMVQFVYKQQDIEAQFCIPHGTGLGDYKTVCELRRDEVVISYYPGATPVTVSWPYERIIAFAYESGKGPVLLKKIPPEWMTEPGAEKYNPEALINHNAPLPYRLKTIWSTSLASTR